MPRGFLVKRSRKSYRFRSGGEDARRFSIPDRAQPCGGAAAAPEPDRTARPVTVYRVLYSPDRDGAPVRRCSLGASAEPFPVPERLLDPAERSGKGGGKRSKAARKLRVEDDVTTSPVLGLRITEVPVEPTPRPPPGVLECQLCREFYPNPLRLAQHRCSRIVRVQYRCPDCAKVFGCPANLASHRRWHKPKPPDPAGSGSEDARYDCPRCGTRFKRRADLKHLAAHRGPRTPAELRPLNLSARRGAACPACGERGGGGGGGSGQRGGGEQRGGGQRPLRLRHAAQAFRCRRRDKRNPTETRQVVLLQVPLRPVC